MSKKARAKKQTTWLPVRQTYGDVVSDNLVEYVASSTQYPYFKTDVGLPQTIDEAERKYGMDIYQVMYDEEPIISGVIKGLKAKALGAGIVISPSHEKPQPEEIAENPEAEHDAEQADIARRYIEYVIKRLRSKKISFYGVLWEMLDAIYAGHKLAEMTRDTIPTGEFAGKDGLAGLTVKPRKNYTFVVSTLNNELRGISAKVPGGPAAIWVGMIGDASQNPWMIAPDKFFIYRVEQRAGDPNGVSWFRATYYPYKAKRLLKPERAKTGYQFGGGMISLIAPPSREGQLFPHPETGERQSAEQITQWAGMQMKNGAVATFLHGTTINVHQPSADPKFFESEVNIADREMVISFCATAREFLEAKHGSKADSETSADLGDEIVKHIQGSLSEAVELNVFRPLVADNYGEEFADKYTPKLTLAATRTADFADNATAAAAIGYTLDPSQFAWFEENVLNIRRREITETPEDDGLSDDEEVAAEAAGFPNQASGSVPAQGTADKRPGPKGKKAAGGKDSGRRPVDARTLRQVDEGRAGAARGSQSKAS